MSRFTFKDDSDSEREEEESPPRKRLAPPIFRKTTELDMAPFSPNRKDNSENDNSNNCSDRPSITSLYGPARGMGADAGLEKEKKQEQEESMAELKFILVKHYGGLEMEYKQDDLYKTCMTFRHDNIRAVHYGSFHQAVESIMGKNQSTLIVGKKNDIGGAVWELSKFFGDIMAFRKINACGILKPAILLFVIGIASGPGTLSLKKDWQQGHCGAIDLYVTGSDRLVTEERMYQIMDNGLKYENATGRCAAVVILDWHKNRMVLEHEASLNNNQNNQSGKVKEGKEKDVDLKYLTNERGVCQVFQCVKDKNYGKMPYPIILGCSDTCIVQFNDNIQNVDNIIQLSTNRVQFKKIGGTTTVFNEANAMSYTIAYDQQKTTFVETVMHGEDNSIIVKPNAYQAINAVRFPFWQEEKPKKGKYD